MYNTQIRENEILFSQEGELIRLTPCGRNAIRFQAFPGGRVLDENYNLMPRETEAEITDHGHCVTMTCGELTVTLGGGGWTSYAYKGVPILEQGATERTVYVPEGEWILTRDGTAYTKGYHTITAQIHEFIALVRKGAPVLEAFAR